jgi:hypothetical protein
MAGPHSAREVTMKGASVLIAAMMVAGPPQGQTTSKDAMTPSDPHERLTVFEGTWELDAPAVSAAGVRQRPGRETCEWLTGGRRHMICRNRYQNPDGVDRERTHILSYRTADSTYIAYFAFPAGDNLLYHGRIEGERWIMDMQPTPLLPKNKRFREIITPTENGLRFVEEVSTDGGPWTVTEDYRMRRVK